MKNVTSYKNGKYANRDVFMKNDLYLKIDNVKKILNMLVV